MTEHKRKVNKKVCTSPTCLKNGEAQLMGNFYVSSMTDMFSDGKIPICKECCIQLFEDKGFDGFQQVMKLINKPILKKRFKGDYRQYLTQMVSLPQYKNKTYEDSDMFTYSKTLENSDLESDYDDEEVISYWGKGRSREEYEFLQGEMDRLESSFECTDYGMEMIMKDICFINLEIEKLRMDRASDNHTAITKLIDIRSKLMNDGSMKPIQSTGSEVGEHVTLGTLIRKWETEEPVPEPLTNEMKEYIDTFMVGHLAKMQGLDNEATKKYEEALAEYTINYKDIHKMEDDE